MKLRGVNIVLAVFLAIHSTVFCKHSAAMSAWTNDTVKEDAAIETEDLPADIPLFQQIVVYTISVPVGCVMLLMTAVIIQAHCGRRVKDAE